MISRRQHFKNLVVSYIYGTFIGAALTMPLFALFMGDNPFNSFLDILGMPFVSGLLAVLCGWLFMWPGLLLGYLMSFRYINEGKMSLRRWIVVGTLISVLASLLMVSFYPVTLLCGVCVMIFLRYFSLKSMGLNKN